MHHPTSSSWLKEAIIYHILIDRFADKQGNQLHNSHKPTFLGGHIQGIIKRFNHIKDLGINTILLSPCTQATAYHGYHITDYFTIDPHFGTEQDLKELITLAHKNNIKIIADFVPNHCSKNHPFFQDAITNKDSKYKEWFYFTTYPGTYLSFLCFPDIPKLNLTNKDTQAYILDAARYLLNLGFDGLRIDHIIGLPFPFLHTFTTTLKKEYPNIAIFGEAWTHDTSWEHIHTLCIPDTYLTWLKGIHLKDVIELYDGIIDGVLDFDVCFKLRNNTITSPQQLEQYNKQLPKKSSYIAFIENHDMDRLLLTQTHEQYKTTIHTLCKSSQPIIIYYGADIGMLQKKSMHSKQHHGDLYLREPMQWNNINKHILDTWKEQIQNRKEKEE